MFRPLGCIQKASKVGGYGVLLLNRYLLLFPNEIWFNVTENLIATGPHESYTAHIKGADIKFQFPDLSRYSQALFTFREQSLKTSAQARRPRRTGKVQHHEQPARFRHGTTAGQRRELRKLHLRR